MLTPIKPQANGKSEFSYPSRGDTAPEAEAEETNKPHLEKQQRRARAQEAERVARKKREDAIAYEHAQRHLHNLSRTALEGLESKMVQAERNCRDAKRLWLDAMDLQSRIARELEAAKEACECALGQERMAEAQRAFADQEEAEMRAAREEAEADELEADDDDDTRRLAELAESIRKMKQLQRVEEEDRVAKMRREEKHRAAEERRQDEERCRDEEQRKEDEARAAEDELEQKRCRQEEQTRREEEKQECLEQEQRDSEVRGKQEQEECARTETEERQRRYEQAAARERARCFKRDQNEISSYTWTSHIAVTHFKIVSTDFDDTRFCDAQPLTFESVPWPILHTPEHWSLDAVQWGAVEAFFDEVKALLGLSEYKQLVEKTQRRFHPDKWKARLQTVLDEALRDKLEAAVNIVSQTVNPIWHKSRC